MGHNAATCNLFLHSQLSLLPWLAPPQTQPSPTATLHTPTDLSTAFLTLAPLYHHATRYTGLSQLAPSMTTHPSPMPRSPRSTHMAVTSSSSPTRTTSKLAGHLPTWPTATPPHIMTTTTRPPPPYTVSSPSLRFLTPVWTAGT